MDKDTEEFIQRNNALIQNIAKAVISHNIGHYYFSSLLGKKEFTVDDILCTKHGTVVPRVKCDLAIEYVLERLEQVHKTDYAMAEMNILQKLKSVDQKMGVPTGYKLLELLARYFHKHQLQKINKIFYSDKMRKAKQSIKALNHAKEKMLKAFERELDPERLQQLSRTIDGYIRASAAQIALSTIYIYSKEGYFPCTPLESFIFDPVEGTQPTPGQPPDIEFRQASKEMPFIDSLVKKVRGLLCIEGKYTELESARVVSFFLEKLGMKKTADTLRKKTTHSLSV